MSTIIIHKDDSLSKLDQREVAVKTALDIRGLVKYLGTKKIVDGIDLSIAAGENVVLLGPSGCGKTTTLRMVAGLIQPDGGEIRLGGGLVSGPNVMVPTEHRHLGMVFQNYAVWPHKSVFGNVAYGLQVARRPKPEIKQRVDRALDLIQLGGLADRFPGDLSGGQQQRVALARAIVTEPSLLLLDEPLSNLDAVLRKEMRIELKSLTRRIGITSLFVTHDQEEALALADRIVVMNGGRIEQIGTPEDVYLRPKNKFVAGFIGTANFIGGTVEARDEVGHRLLIDTTLGAKVWARTSSEALRGQPLGAKVTLLVRPEGLFVGAAQGEVEPNAKFNAQLTGAAFLGNRYELKLVAGEQILHGQAASLSGFRDDQAPIVIDGNHAWVLPESPG